MRSPQLSVTVPSRNTRTWVLNKTAATAIKSKEKLIAIREFKVLFQAHGFFLRSLKPVNRARLMDEI